MPNRIIKESICRSESIDSLSWFEEVLFYRLIVACDDFGRFDGREAVIKGSCFPLKDDVTKKQIADALGSLSTVGLIRVYEVRGRSFLQLTAWGKHQQIRAKHSKYPAPEEGYWQDASSETKSGHMISNDIMCPRESKNENRESYSRNEDDAGACAENYADMCSRFSEFCEAYPKKSNVLNVQGQYSHTLQTTDGLTEDLLISAAKNYADYCKSMGYAGAEERYIMLPENWLRKSRWTEYLPENYKKPTRTMAKKFAYANFEQREYDYKELERKLLGQTGRGDSG